MPDIESSHQQIWLVVPAAGVGTRIQAQVPKQYLILQGKTILEHTITRLLQVPGLSGLILVHSLDDEKITDLDIVQTPRVELVVGGSERSNSVLNGLTYLADKANDDDWVLVHDAARPCIDLADIKKLIGQLKDDSVGGILAVPVSDTVKRVVTANQISETLDRTELWQAQTPQMFRFGLLRSALQQAVSQQQVITDEASAIEFCGLHPQMVMGHYDNIKITHANDIVMAKAIMADQSLTLK